MNHYLTAIETMKAILGEMDEPMEGFRRKTYPDSFEKVYQRMLPAFDSIEELYHTVGEPQEMLANMADALVGRAEEIIASQKRRGQKDTEMISLNMKMAAYIYPAILRYKGDSTQPLTYALTKRWKEAFPKSNVQPADYETIEKGFHRKFCYITTAVCETFGKPDDCYELEQFRRFRDGYLAASPEGEELVRHYYDIAPSIVKHIGRSGNSREIYKEIWDSYLSPCLEMIETGQNEACVNHYACMVETLEKQYFLAPSSNG